MIKKNAIISLLVKNEIYSTQPMPKLLKIFKYKFSESKIGKEEKEKGEMERQGKIKTIKLGNDDYRNLGRKFSPEEMEKYLDPFGFINDGKQEKIIDTVEEKENVKEVKNDSKDNKENQKRIKKMPKEVGMKPRGPEPTRYGDWERNGKCVDF